MRIEIIRYVFGAILLLSSVGAVNAVKGQQIQIRRRYMTQQTQYRRRAMKDTAKDSGKSKSQSTKKQIVSTSQETVSTSQEIDSEDMHMVGSDSEEMHEGAMDSQEDSQGLPMEMSTPKGTAAPKMQPAELSESKGSSKGGSKKSGEAKTSGATKENGEPVLGSQTVPPTPTFDSEDIYKEIEAESQPPEVSDQETGILQRPTPTMRRQVPVISLQFDLPVDTFPTPDSMDLSIYNELLLTTETYLDVYYEVMFTTSGSPAKYYSESSKFHLTTDPVIVDLHVSTDFVLPGDVPTLDFLLQMTKSAFKQHYEREYLTMLSSMSSTNPFQRATAVRIVDSTIGYSTSFGGGRGEPAILEASKRKVVLPLLAVLSCLVLTCLSFVWFHKANKKLLDDDDDDSRASLVSTGGISIRNGGGDSCFPKNARGTSGRTSDVGISKHSQSGFANKPYGADDATLKYLESIRERYQIEGTDDDMSSSSSSSSFQDVEDAKEKDKMTFDSDDSTIQAGRCSDASFIDEKDNVSEEDSVSKYSLDPPRYQIETVLSEEVSDTETPPEAQSDSQPEIETFDSKDYPGTNAPLSSQQGNQLADDVSTGDTDEERPMGSPSVVIASQEVKQITGQQETTDISNSADQTDGKSEDDSETTESKDQDHFDYLLDVNSDDLGDNADLLSLT